MPGYDGFGVFTRAYNWTADKLALIKIQSARMDAEFDNYATAMNQVILRNGVAPFSGNLKLGNNSITGIASGAAATPSVQFSVDVTTGIFLAAAGVLGLAAAGVERARATATGFSVTGDLAVSGGMTFATNFGIGTLTPRSALDVAGIASFRGAFEDCLISATAITGAINIDYKTAPVIVFTSNAAGNWSFNIRGDGATTINSLMAIGQMLTLAVEVPQGATAYYCTTITVDGAAAAQLIWQGAAPTAGNVSGTDVYLIRVIKTAAATFKVRASQSQEK